MLRPQDIVVLLKLSLASGRPPYLLIAQDLGLYPSEVYASIKRARLSQLVHGEKDSFLLNRTALQEFLQHGIRYAFPAEVGALTRGVPTGYAAPPLNQLLLAGNDPPPVWPHGEGTVRGYSFSPLHKNVPIAAEKDQRLYELLALVDAVRGGRVRERELAKAELKRRLESEVNDSSQS